MPTFTQLREGNICGVIDSYGAIHSQFTERLSFHDEFFVGHYFIKWRWDYNKSIWWISPEMKPDSEQYTSIMIHLEKKYGIKFWDNGHHDLDYFHHRLAGEEEIIS